MTLRKIGEREQLAVLPTGSEQWSELWATGDEVRGYTQGHCRQLDW